LAKERVYGNEKAEYNLMKPYFDEMKAVNAGTIAEVVLDAVTNHFVRCYTIPNYGCKFLQNAIPVICQDMAHLGTKVPGNACLGCSGNGWRTSVNGTRVGVNTRTYW
jgi:hypothetical protein